MRKLALVVGLLLGLSSCAVMKQGGEALCAAQEKTAEVITEGGAWLGLGGTGPMIADVLNMSIEFFCTIIDVSLSAPSDVGDMLGVTTSEPTGVEGEDGSY